MLAISSNNSQFSPQLRNRLKATIMGLGLVRLQMDVGLTEEARATLASLQIDFSLLLSGVGKPMEKPTPEFLCGDER